MQGCRGVGGCVPVTVDNVGARLLPATFQLFEFSERVVPQLFIAALQQTLCCRQRHVHPDATFMLRMVYFLKAQDKTRTRIRTKGSLKGSLSRRGLRSVTINKQMNDRKNAFMNVDE